MSRCSLRPFFAALLGLLATSLSASAASAKPNIVLILSDDMGWSDLGCYGGEIPTPNLDALATNGLRFTNFYNTARCSPTRAALLTGVYQHQAGMGILGEDPNQEAPPDAAPGYTRFLNHHCVTIAEALKPAGYRTYMAGKWHLGYHGQEKWPRQRGFDRYYGIIAGASSYFRPKDPRGLTLDNTRLPEPEGDYYTTDAFTDHALEFIKSTPANEPFFLYLAFNAPHWPLHAPEADVKKFIGLHRAGWDTLRAERWQRQLAAGLVDPSWGLSPRDDGARAWSMLNDEQKSELDYRMAVYTAQVYRMDLNIGRVVEYLRTAGALENTLFVFVNDNGACAEPYNDLGGGDFSAVNQPRAEGGGGGAHSDAGSSYGTGWANASNTPFRRYKARLYEGGIATPLIIHWPAGLKTTAGSLTTARGYLTDLMPTFLEAAGATYPTQYKGSKITPLYSTSLLPVLRATGRPDPEWMFWEHYGDRAARKGDWKALGRIGSEKWELYDLAHDRTEQINLAEMRPELVSELATAWLKWAETHDVLPRHLGTTAKH